MDLKICFGVVSFIVVFILISTEKVNKTIAALIGASVFLLSQIITQHKAFEEIDWNVIFLLVGMMIIVGIAQETGLFQYIAIRMAKIARGNPYKILLYLSIITAVFSALLDNVTTILILTPITVLIAVELDVPPIPFVISEIIASNIGGTATLIGDPPNLMIGSSAKLSFLDFVIHLAPLVAILIVVFSIFAYFVWGKKMHVTNERKARIMEFKESKFIVDKKFLYKTLAVFFLVLIGFLLHNVFHLEAATIALSGASLLMILTTRGHAEKFFEAVEWETIFFFIGLFILVGGLSELGVIKIMAEKLIHITEGNLEKTSFVVLWSSGILSGIVDNIPFVATMIPLIKEFIQTSSGSALAAAPLWWSLAIGACLGGNATLIGASANVVASELCKKSGYTISFMEFTKYGFIITIINLMISSGYIYLRYFY